MLQAYLAFAQAAAPGWDKMPPSTILQGSDVLMDRMPRAREHLPDLASLPRHTAGSRNKVSFAELEALRWLYGDDQLRKGDAAAARMHGATDACWGRYLKELGRLHAARGFVLGYTDPAGPVHVSVFGQAIKHLESQDASEVDVDILAQLILFRDDPDARRAHFLAAEDGKPVRMPTWRPAADAGTGVALA